jgi:hypothetical protein
MYLFILLCHRNHAISSSSFIIATCDVTHESFFLINWNPETAGLFYQFRLFSNDADTQIISFNDKKRYQIFRDISL